jgi:hypothetical protein
MNKDSSRTTILVISTGFLILHMLFNWEWAIFVTLAVSVAGLISLWVSKKIEWLWMKLAQVLGLIVPNILLSLIFFLILLPISMIYRLIHKDPLKLAGGSATNFTNSNKKPDKKSFEMTW